MNAIRGISAVAVALTALAACAPGQKSAYSYYETVEIHARDNCVKSASSANRAERAASVRLPAGRYRLVPAGGAMSNWKTDAEASRSDSRAWHWLVRVDAGEGVQKLGTMATRYATPAGALRGNSDASLSVSMGETGVVRFWVEDEWRGRNYCHDNRGAMTVGIEKLS